MEEEEELGAFLTTVWAIWGARCRLLMEGEVWVPGDTLAYACKITKEVWEVPRAIGCSREAAVVHPVRWTSPREDMVKVNVDAGSLGELGSGVGVVCREARGEVLAAGVFQFDAAWDVKIAEAKAVYHGLRLAKEMDFAKVIVESDSLVVIQALRNKSGGSSDFGLIVDDILAFCCSFELVCWSFVKRSGNTVAHILAHFQPWEVGKRVWVDDIPCDVLAIASKDMI